MTLGAPSPLPRNFDLDFLRGLFVLGILFYHIVPGTPVGFGQGSMEGFFCLSGYLITLTLLRRIPLGWGGLRAFAANRLRRLMPVLLFYLLLVGILNLAFERASWRLVFASTAFSVVGFYNWFQIFQGKALQGMGGIWSLSVEDQFYIIVMLLAALVIWKKNARPGKALLFLYGGFLLSALLVRVGNCFLWRDLSGEMVSYATFPRLWAFGWGGMVALVAGQKGLRPMWLGKAEKINPLVWLGAAVVAMISVRTYDAAAFLTGWLFCSVLIGGTILALTARPSDAPPLFLRIPGGIWVAHAGVACYPIYLFQAFEKNLNLEFPWYVSLIVALALGAFVHLCYERRFYQFPSFQKQTTIFPL